MNSETLLTQLKEIVGVRGYREGAAVEPRNFEDLMGARAMRPRLLLRPANTGEVSQLLRTCHLAGQPITPQGGMTGLVSAAAPIEGEIALSLERMNTIQEVDTLTGTMTVEAGVPLQTIQEEAARNGLLFPLDLGARGSCTIGGNLSTNAGGNRVIRYGMTRELVLGVEAVLADGTVIESLNKLRKNNTGYDLKQLFIGSEGTLGIITRVVLRLLPQPTTQMVALCGVKDFDGVVGLLGHAQKYLAGNLSAFEVLWNNAYRLIDRHIPGINVPLNRDHAYYVLLESMGSDAARDQGRFVEVLDTAMQQGLVADVVVADSEKQIRSLWRIRDAAAEVSSGAGYMHTYDISLTVGNMGHFGEEVVKRLAARWPEAVIGLFGHIGDGNLHIVVNVGPQTRSLHDDVDQIIYGLVKELAGSVSAEHGIGIMKRPYLDHCRNPEEIQLMRRLKDCLDPKHILSPGRVFD